MTPKNSASFGNPVLDERLGGPVERGLHVLIGGPGTGKSVAALQFLAAGLERGERAAMLTRSQPEDVVKQARSIGINLSPHLGSGRCVLLGYQTGFRDRYRRTLEPTEAFEELLGFLCNDGPPDRLVFDAGGPLVESRERGIGGELVVELVSRLRATALLTLTAEDPGALGSAFEPVFEAASLILQLNLADSGRREFLLRKTPGPLAATGPISFEIRKGAGIVPIDVAQGQRATDMSPDVRRRVLLVDLAESLPEELWLWFKEAFELHHVEDPVDAFPELAARDFGLVAIHLDRRTVGRGLHVMRQLRRVAKRPPILIMCAYNVRAIDRAWALRVGADDFISGGLNPEELAWRIEALQRRGRNPVTTEEDSEAMPFSTQESVGAKPEELRDILRSQLKAPGSSIFSLVLLRPGEDEDVDSLASHVAKRMRRSAGDRVTVSGERVEVYLHGALASHAQCFLKRVRTKPWSRVGYEVLTSPTDRSQLMEVVSRRNV